MFIMIHHDVQPYERSTNKIKTSIINTDYIAAIDLTDRRIQMIGGGNYIHVRREDIDSVMEFLPIID